MSFMFEKLEVYQKAVDFAENATRITENFPTHTYYLSDQLNRAALSISANIAEGNGRKHAKERKQFFYIARGSTHECVPILEVCLRKNFIAPEVHEKLKTDLEVIAKMLSGLIRGLENKPDIAASPGAK